MTKYINSIFCLVNKSGPGGGINTGQGLNQKPKTLEMNFRSESLLTASAAIVNANLQPVATLLPEVPAVDLVEAVNAWETPFTAPAEAHRHVRVTLTDGTERYVSFHPHVYTEQDDYRDYLLVELQHVHVDGKPAQPDAGLEAELENWILEQEASR